MEEQEVTEGNMKWGKWKGYFEIIWNVDWEEPKL